MQQLLLVVLGVCIVVVIGGYLVFAAKRTEHRVYVPATFVGATSTLFIHIGRSILDTAAPTPLWIPGLACALLVCVVTLMSTVTTSFRGIFLDDALKVLSLALVFTIAVRFVTDNALSKHFGYDLMTIALTGVSYLQLNRFVSHRIAGAVEAQKYIRLTTALGFASYVIFTLSSILMHEMIHAVGVVVMVISGITMGTYFYKRTRLRAFSNNVVPPTPKPSSFALLSAMLVGSVAMTIIIQQPHFADPIIVGTVALIVVSLIMRQALTIGEYLGLSREAAVAQEYYSSLINNSHDAIIMCDIDSLHAQFTNNAARHLTANVQGGEHLPLPAIIGIEAGRVRRAVEEVRDSGKVMTLSSRKGTAFLETVLSIQQDQVRATVRDITERQSLRAKMVTLAYLDILTGLANRQSCFKKMNALMEQGEQYDVLFLDLNRFKQINDSSGHFTGDSILEEVAERLRDVCSQSVKVVGRIGGDEFLVVHTNGRSFSNDLARRIIDALSEPYAIGSRVFDVGVSIGVAHSDPSEEAAQVIQRADIAMYNSKRGQLDVVHYTRELSTDAAELLAKQEAVTGALRRQDFLMYLQPLVDSRTAEVTSCEALIRWRDLTGKVRSPFELLQCASQSDSLDIITHWVMQRAALALSLTAPTSKIAINIPPHTFLRPSFLDELLATCDQYSVSTNRLTLELTEDATVIRPAETRRAIKAAVEHGFPVVVDDFGVGYASLSNVTTLPVTGVKIDQQLVVSALHDERRRRYIRSLVRVFNDAGFSCVAEGIETAELTDLVADLGVPTSQGYFYGKPQLVDDCGDLTRLSSWHQNEPHQPANQAQVRSVKQS